MKFQIGQYYQHSSGGEVIHILGDVHTFFHGHALLAETSCGNLIPVGSDETSATNFHQVSGWPDSTYIGNGIPKPTENSRKCDPRDAKEAI